ncbi:MAG TPA: HAMP domain-containing sensor histidine kinase [Bryobacteraceae bacterium]|nr:HAMP domain-containing sensor histidine kinase [Bryobacteraceae bacterium]
MARELSIRFRLTAWYALFLAASLGLLGGLIWLTLRQRLLSEVDEDLAGRAARLQAYVVTESAELPPVQLGDELEEFCQALATSDRVDLRGPEGFEFHYPSGPGSRIPHNKTLQRQFNVGSGVFHLQLSSSLNSIDHTLDLLRLLLLGLIPLVVAVACAGGAWLSRRALQPVDEITSAAQAVAIDNLSLRLRTPQTGDELQRLTEVWNTMLGRLEAAVRTLSQFAADASHELRTPLAVIRTSAELALRRARSPEAYRSSLVEISEEAERMTRLVEDLLFLARGDARAAETPVEPLDLDVLVQEIRSELLSLAGTKQIRISHIPSQTGAAVVSGNAPALRRLILVLLDNAIKYSRPGSEVIVAVTGDAETAAVNVQDFGIGISPSDRPHIFNRFFQADKARADSGFGLGLALADTIARAHGATIGVTSKEGAGSIFRVAFHAAATVRRSVA